MRQKRFFSLIFLALSAVLLLVGCGSDSKFSSNLSTKSLPEHWSVTDAGLSFDGEERESFFLSGETLASQDFQ